MKAAVFSRVGAPLSIETVNDPRPRSGDVVLRVAHCGICGTDLHMTEADGILSPGMILGHEFAGVIVDAGDSRFCAGGRATAIPMHSCGSCQDCDDGYFAHCSSLRVAGIHIPGAFAEYVAVDRRLVQMLPAGVTLAEGALVEPLAVAHRAIRLAGSIAGEDVLILGGGPIGGAAAMFAKLRGARSVIVSEPLPSRRQLMMGLGASATIDPLTETLVNRVHAIAGQRPNIVIECVGIAGMISAAIELAANRGRVIVTGTCFGKDRISPIDALCKELTIRFSSGYQECDFEAAIDAIAKRCIDPTPMITDRIDLDQLPNTFEQLRNGSDGCKVLVTL